MFKREDVQEGDVLVCTEGNECCWSAGREYKVKKLPDGELVFRPDCFDRYSDYVHMVNIHDGQLSQFYIRERYGPW